MVTTMKAVAVFPSNPDSIHLAELPVPNVNEVPDGRGALVKALKVGLDSTDKEINAGEYGAAPAGSEFLVLGHESLGVVEQVGPNVSDLAPGDHVVSMVRHPGGSLYDLLGMPDMTTDDTYYEHGISLLHGFLTERYVSAPEHLIKLPEGLRDVGVLLEPVSVVEKGIAQAFEIQRRLRVWHPKRAAVVGAGTIGLLAAMSLRLRGLEVTTFDLREAGYLNSDLIDALGARYISTQGTSLVEASKSSGPFDLIFEATGFSPVAFEAMEVLGKNGVLVLSSVTGGDRRAEVPTDAINLGFVLGNKVMVGIVNANRQHYDAAVSDVSLAQLHYPGWLSKLLTHRVVGLDNYQHAFDLLTSQVQTIKVYIQIAED